MRAREFWNRYFSIRKCGGCGQILSFENCYDALCPDCLRKWNIAKTETCQICNQSVAECTCQPKILASAGVLTLRKLVLYFAKREYEPQNRLIYHIKKKQNTRLLRFLASELSLPTEQALSVLGLEAPYRDVVIVAVPRGRQGRATYGFDQAECIGRALGERMGILYVPALGRRRGGKEQKRLSAKDRRKNMSRRIYTSYEEMIRGKCVILLDDVVTTGSSMAVCATALLKRAGAKYVIALSVAQTPQEKIG